MAKQTINEILARIYPDRKSHTGICGIFNGPLKKFNEVLTCKNPDAHCVKGIIYDQFNSPLKQVIVQAFDKDLRTEQLLGAAVTDDKGCYLIYYSYSKFSKAEKDSADLFIRVFSNAGHKQEIGMSSVHFNVPLEFTLDFKVDGSPYIGLSEFDHLINVIQPLLKNQHLEISDLTENEVYKDISFLSGETGEQAAKISLLPIAFTLAKTTTATNLRRDTY